jgi:hypothetical protein
MLARIRFSLIAVASTALLAVAVPVAAADDSMDLNTRASSWDAAAATLGTAGSLWEPKWTGELERTSPFGVAADNLAFGSGSVTAGDTVASTRYGRGARQVSVMEKWADTGWAADPVFTTSAARVGTVRLRLGTPGMRTTVTATVWADCVEQPANADPKPVPKSTRCSRGDVLRTGGYLQMTARPASTMTAPGTTTVFLRTRGLSYAELLRVARSVEQVAGTPTVAGSAQMVAMCRQMVSGRMTVEQASSFAQANGYTARVGSIDGQSLPVTADYRPDRFTLEMVGNVVAGCTYG